MEPATFITGALIVLIVGGGLGYLISIYNTLVLLGQNVEKAWSNIDVLLQQRHDELLNLVETCKGYLKHEREVLEEVTRLRRGFERAATIDEKARTENLLNQAFGRLRLAVEAYPDLKASQNLLQLQGRISALESSTADRREFYNDSVNMYNVQIGSFPDLLLARLFAYRPHEFLEVPAESKKTVKVTLT